MAEISDNDGKNGDGYENIRENTDQNYYYSMHFSHHFSVGFSSFESIPGASKTNTV